MVWFRVEASFIFILSIIQYCRNGHTPCTYPVPSDKQYRDLCSPYLNLQYLCDIDGVVSKTAADQIHSVLSKYECYKNGEITIAIAAMENLNLPGTLPESSDFLVDSEWYCLSTSTSQMNKILQWKNSTSVAVYLEWFTIILRRRWFRSDCGSNVMFLTVTDSVGDIDNREIIAWPVVQISFGQELYNSLGKRFCDSLIKSMFVWHSEGMAPSTTIASALDHIALRMQERSLNGPEFSGIPFWAIMVFFGCSAMVAFLMFLDYIIVRRKGLSIRKTKADGNAPKPARKSENISTHLLF